MRASGGPTEPPTTSRIVHTSDNVHCVKRDAAVLGEISRTVVAPRGQRSHAVTQWSA